jgi:hypothetical protein
MSFLQTSGKRSQNRKMEGTKKTLEIREKVLKHG